MVNSDKDNEPTQGMKYDQGKLRYSLIPTRATQGMAEVLTFGAKKYAPNSWQTVPNGKARYLDALIRHLEAYRAGEVYDKESGIMHLAHLLTNTAFLIHLDDTALVQDPLQEVGRW
jgi:hypothetical protein